MNFVESESYLYSLGNEVAAMKLGIENIRTLLAALANPQEKYLKVQVAGTNGKGSVCSFLDSICREACIPTGLYTSPHLVSITERVKIDGVDISEVEFARHATTVRETAESLLAEGKLEYRPTFFEQVTAIALVAFAEAKVKIAILETGLGGRLDATTAANAEIAAITRIDLDHQEYLGDTIQEIAAEKAAIIGPGTKAVIIGPQPPDGASVIEDRLRNIKGGNTSGSECAVIRVNPQWLSQNRLPDDLGLKGRHQRENASIAVSIAHALRCYFEIGDDNIARGLVNTRHPGRLEYSGRWLFDGAHNPGGARALAAYLDEFEQRPVTMIFGAMREKDVAEIAAILFPRADHVVVTQPGNPRSMTADELASSVPDNFPHEKVSLTDDVREAISTAEKLAGEDGLILVTGSLYLVGEVKSILER